jgi:hypothetical protein
MCRDRFAQAGRPALHVLDVLAGDVSAERAARRGPTITERHERRRVLHESLLRDLWGEEPATTARLEDEIALELAPGLADELERRLIRLHDVREVIAHADTTAERFVDPTTGLTLASLTVGTVTFWVEFERRGDGSAYVTRAYSHRMQFTRPEGERLAPADAVADGAGGVSRWRCGVCDLPLVERNVTVSYLAAGFPVPLPACPSCGAVLIDEELALGKMAEVERTMEDK